MSIRWSATNRPDLVGIAISARHGLPSRRRSPAAPEGGAGRAARRRAGRAAGRRQDDARAAGPARRALAAGAARSSCWSRGGWRRAPRRGAWRATLGEAVGETVGYRMRLDTQGRPERRASRSSPRACSPGMLAGRSGARRRRAASSSTSSTSAACTPTSASRWRCDSAAALLRRTCACWSCRRRSTAAPVARAAGRRAGDRPPRAACFPVETRYLDRDAGGTRSRTRSAGAVRGALAQESGRRPGVPAGRRGDPPRRGAARGAGARARRATSRRSTATSRRPAGRAPSRRAPPGRAQGRARHLHRRDQPDHRGRARRDRRRADARCRASRRAPA